MQESMVLPSETSSDLNRLSYKGEYDEIQVEGVQS